MAEITEHTKAIVQQDRLNDIRARADNEGTFCLFASLYEISSIVKGSEFMPPRAEEMWQEHLKRFPDLAEGKVPVDMSLEVMMRFSEEIGLKVKQILVNPSFLDKVTIPPQVADKINRVTGTQSVSVPHLRVMCQNDGTGYWYTHAETDTGDEKSEARFKVLAEKGWDLSAMVIEFENNSNKVTKDKRN